MQIAQLSSSGLVIEGSQCLSCFGMGSELIKYADILHFEEQQACYYVVKYIHWKGKEAEFKQKTIKIPPQQHPNGTASLSTLDAEQTVGAMDDDQLGDSSSGGGESSLEQKIMARSYANCLDPKARKPLLVILNPKSGPGNAVKQYEEKAAPVFAAAGVKTRVVVTSRAKEATDIARKASMAEHDCIVCVSGDGLPHEVINGLATRREDAVEALQHFAVAQLPGGSGNGMALSLNDGKSDWVAVAAGIVKGIGEPYDLMAVSQGDNVFYSFLSQSFGIVADCDLGTEDMRWMGGARFTVGIVMKCLSGNKYPCKVAYHESSSAAPRATTLVPQVKVDDEIPSDWKVESHPDLSMFYVGKMPWMSSDAQVFPTSDPTDGAMDMLVWDTSNTGPIKALSHLINFEKGSHVSGVHFYKKVDAFRLIPQSDKNYLSIDGEAYPCTPIQVSVLPSAARFVIPVGGSRR